MAYAAQSADLVRLSSNSARQFAGAIPTLAALSARYSLVDAVLAEFELRRHFEAARTQSQLVAEQALLARKIESVWRVPRNLVWWHHTEGRNAPGKT